MATCPECEADIPVDEYEIDKGEQLKCPECDSLLEVVSTSPIEFEVVFDEDEDEEEEEDDLDDDDEDEEDEEDWDE